MTKVYTDMSSPSEIAKSITNARRYLDYVLASNGKMELPEIPSRCVISYTSDIIEIIKQTYPHQSVDLGCTNPTHIHFFFPHDDDNFAIARGLHGAPMAAVLLEELIALGFEEFLVIGASGHPARAENPILHVGDLLLTTDAFIFEGTSSHYLRGKTTVRPSKLVTEGLRKILTKLNIDYKEGSVATTDALYRETAQFIKLLIDKDILAIDMEMSALFTVAQYHRKIIGGLLFITDLIREEGVWELGLLGNNFFTLQSKLIRIIKEFVTAK